MLSIAWKISKPFAISVIKILNCARSLAQVFVCTYTRQVIRCIILTQCLAVRMLCKLNVSVPIFCMCMQDKRAKGAFLKSYKSLAMTNTVFAEKVFFRPWLQSTSDSGYTYTEILSQGFCPCGSSACTAYVSVWVVCSIWPDRSPGSLSFSRWLYLHKIPAKYSEIWTVIFITISPKLKRIEK